ncbi:DUF3662 and FHA domain-containing protein [Paeniglutamicibacter psychrophenolicus]|uniref:FHA domain-containing protein n=1 Tax=Paeniglutamicibacter psychrophenolicus TaxID=257454 RepID=A0ABS4W8P0_9MICC|nr:DUF3662 and FHA domain-containing protein [Paeniglutamicibacter psychrophenolicus]MBP2372570.1 hypothetical protein [Paeniglutamicibacter psychrophenolicus]
MGLIDNVERGLEKLVTSVFRGSGSSEVKPVEIASRLRNQMDAKSLTISQARTLAPNHFIIRLADEDFARAREWGAPLARELCTTALEHAKSQGYTLQGAVEVNFRKDPELKPGGFEIDATTSDASTPEVHNTPAAPPAPSAPPRAAARMQPVLDISGQRYALNHPSIVLGRSADTDIPIEDPGVSRRHLKIEQRGASTWAVDLGSTNGSFVNGQKIVGETELHDGSNIAMGQTRIIFRLVPQSQGDRA